MNQDATIFRYVGGLAAAMITISALAVSAAAIAKGSQVEGIEASGSVMSIAQMPRAYIFDAAHNTISTDGEILVCLATNETGSGGCRAPDGKNAWSRMTEIQIIGHQPVAYEYRFVNSARLLFVYFSTLKPTPPMQAASKAFVPTGPVIINAERVTVQQPRNRPGHSR